MADWSARRGSLMSPDDRKFAADWLEPVPAADCGKLQVETAGLPTDYIDWLQQIGWGELDGRFMFYSGPTSVALIYGHDAPTGRLVAIGDDMSGYVVGIDLSRKDVVEWSPKGEEASRWTSFTEFVLERVSELRQASEARGQ